MHLNTTCQFTAMVFFVILCSVFLKKQQVLCRPVLGSLRDFHGSVSLFVHHLERVWLFLYQCISDVRD